MATYEWKNADSLRLQELDIYGSSRLGMLREDSLLACLGCSTITNTGSATLFTGSKLYELTNHLGNVLSTITDKKVYVDADANDTADYSVPEIASQQDYYPFGMLMPGRRISLSDYRFGFNKQEKVDEISGLGNHNTAMFWEYDPRRGIRWNKDPLTYPWQSPYSCYNNNPIIFVDPLGLFASRKEAREYKNENNLSGRVRKNDDGIYSIDDKKVGSSIFKDAEFGITKGALVQGTRVDNKHLSPLQLGVEWASGNGARSRAFTEGDDITTKYKQHEFVNETRKKIKEQLQNINGEIKLPIEGNNPYSLRGIEGVEKYLKDYSTLGTGGLIGNLVYTYLGSHSLQYTITDIDVKNRNAIVTFFVFNTSTMQSATRPPLIGYQEWYQNSIGKIIDNQFQSGPFSETEQSIEWIENIKY